MIFYKALKHLHPDLEIDRDFVLRDDGEGVYILNWNVDRPKPTDSEINTAWEEIRADTEAEPLSEIEFLKKQQTDLVFELMMKGVL